MVGYAEVRETTQSNLGAYQLGQRFAEFRLTCANLTETTDLAAWPAFARPQQALLTFGNRVEGGPNEGGVNDTPDRELAALEDPDIGYLRDGIDEILEFGSWRGRLRNPWHRRLSGIRG